MEPQDETAQALSSFSAVFFFLPQIINACLCMCAWGPLLGFPNRWIFIYIKNAELLKAYKCWSSSKVLSRAITFHSALLFGLSSLFLLSDPSEGSWKQKKRSVHWVKEACWALSMTTRVSSHNLWWNIVQGMRLNIHTFLSSLSLSSHSPSFHS